MLIRNEIVELDIEVVEQRKSEECGCPEEDLLIGLCFFTIHLEEEGGGHIFLDMGDWDDEKLVDCKDMEDLRSKAHLWAVEVHKGNIEVTL